MAEACKSYLEGKTFCRDGFPQFIMACSGEGDDGFIPVCLVESICARLFPETGTPKFPTGRNAEEEKC